MPEVSPARTARLLELVKSHKSQSSDRYLAAKRDLADHLNVGYTLTDEQVKSVKVTETLYALWSHVEEDVAEDVLRLAMETEITLLLAVRHESRSSSTLVTALRNVELDAKKEWIDDIRTLLTQVGRVK